VFAAIKHRYLNGAGGGNSTAANFIDTKNTFCAGSSMGNYNSMFFSFIGGYLFYAASQPLSSVSVKIPQEAQSLMAPSGYPSSYRLLL